MSPDTEQTQGSDAPPPEAAPEPTPEEERAAQAEAQNLSEGAVPEQRPQASQQTDPSDTESDLTRRLKEAGAAPETDEPMPQEAYDRANSDAQKKKALKDSVSEAIMVGNVVEATDGPHEGRVFAVTRILSYQDLSGLVTNLSGSPEQLTKSHPDEVEVRAMGDERDGEVLILKVLEHGLEKKNEAWRGSRAGRRH